MHPAAIHVRETDGPVSIATYRANGWGDGQVRWARAPFVQRKPFGAGCYTRYIRYTDAPCSDCSGCSSGHRVDITPAPEFRQRGGCIKPHRRHP